MEGLIMNPINRISDASYFSRLPQTTPLTAKRSPDAGERTSAPAVKQNSDEAYLSSCRPTRLSMELMSQARGHSGK